MGIRVFLQIMPETKMGRFLICKCMVSFLKNEIILNITKQLGEIGVI